MMPRPRTGFTLIELLIVIAMIAVAAHGAITLVTAPMYEAARANAAFQRLAAESALLDALRADASVARGVVVLPDGSGLEFQQSGEQPAVETSVRYTSEADGTIRRTGSDERQRAYHFDRPTSLTLVQDSPGAGAASVQPFSATVALSVGGPEVLPAAVPSIAPDTARLVIPLALEAAIIGLRPAAQPASPTNPTAGTP